MTVTHVCQILCSTFGHPATWNDKTIIKYDTLIAGMKNGSILNKNEFTLLQYNNDGQVVKNIYNGAWVIVDNGYLSWPCRIPHIKMQYHTNILDYQNGWSP